MNRAFEKILEKLDETDFNDIQMVVGEVLLKYGFPYESVVQDEIWDALDELSTNKFAKKIVQEVAEEYKDKYVSKDEVGYMLDSIEMRGDETWMDYYRKALKGLCKLTDKEYNGWWISVKDRLPDKAGSYLVIGKSGGATVTRWYMPSEFYQEGHFGGNSSDYIRYWMPRPEPPKESD